MSQPLISGIDFWGRYRQRIETVLLEALIILKQEKDLSKDEVNINLRLFLCFKKACYRLGYDDMLPVPEGQNPPYGRARKNEPYLKKRPDFYWHKVDLTEPDEEFSDRRYCLECKRLGTPERADRVFNYDYFEKGISRFISEEHKYGLGNDVGGMLGYIQDTSPEDILTEVNNTLTLVDLPVLSGPTEGWQSNGTSRLVHVLIRSFPKQPFTLHHFWIDLRELFQNGSFQTEVRAKNSSDTGEETSSKVIRQPRRRRTVKETNKAIEHK